ncbi:hypothetical protein [Salinisphaera hydrothermalis]|uniref:Acid shock protein n=1 Tax=Salinisphaera hydrothermalis (strain C41B8) TaxID=1304275 RepID=A0A084IHK1_SALHC|nr:hypothetical protein [Salinisphaera hydrothermalis]KEZ76185.1 hypothetical protein C41B8_16329 [Salinisphaera hydrothermalis C41B8]
MNVRKHAVLTALIMALSTVGVAATASAAESKPGSGQAAHKTMTHKKTKHHSAMAHKKKTTHKKHKTAASTKSSKTK